MQKRMHINKIILGLILSLYNLLLPPPQNQGLVCTYMGHIHVSKRELGVGLGRGSGRGIKEEEGLDSVLGTASCFPTPGAAFQSQGLPHEQMKNTSG